MFAPPLTKSSRVTEFDISLTEKLTKIINYKMPAVTPTRLIPITTVSATLVTQNRRAAPAGVYLYRLEAGDRVETKKMLLLK